MRLRQAYEGLEQPDGGSCRRAVVRAPLGPVVLRHDFLCEGENEVRRERTARVRERAEINVWVEGSDRF